MSEFCPRCDCTVCVCYDHRDEHQVAEAMRLQREHEKDQRIADLERQRDELVAAIEDAIAGLQTMVGLDAVTIEAMLEEAIAQAEKDDE